MEQFAPRLLIVDDEEIIGQQLRFLYEERGYAVELAHSAEDALQHLNREDIDLVITDVRLPRMSGLELTAHVKKRYPEIPVIVITGDADVNFAVEVLKSGASDFIVKPFGIESIQESTDVALEKARPFIQSRHLRRSLNTQAHPEDC